MLEDHNLLGGMLSFDEQVALRKKTFLEVYEFTGNEAVGLWKFLVYNTQESKLKDIIFRVVEEIINEQGTNSRMYLTHYLKKGYYLECISDPNTVMLKLEGNTLLGYYFGDGWGEMDMSMLTHYLWRPITKVEFENKVKKEENE